MKTSYFSANVPDQVSPLASGATSCDSRNRDRSAEGMGINCIGLFAFLFFGMGVSVAQEPKNLLVDVDCGLLIRESMAMSGPGFEFVSDKGKPEPLESASVPKEKYARLILDTRIDDSVITLVKDLESIGFVVESTSNIKKNSAELVFRIHPRFKGGNYQSGGGTDQGTNQSRNQIRDGVVHINLPMAIAGAFIGVLLVFGIWEASRWIDARCFDLLQYWQIKNGIFSANVPGQVSPLAFGIRGCSAAEMPKVPKAWGLTEPARSHLFRSFYGRRRFAR